MRILIAAGGTGGHIYPALAVLRSLASGDRTSRCAGWAVIAVSSRSSCPSGRLSTLDRLWLRSLRTVDLSVATRDSTRCASLPRVPQAAGLLARFRPDVALHDGRLRGHPAAAGRRGAARPDAAVGGQPASPGRSVRATARLATRHRGQLRRAPATRCPGRVYVTGHAHPRLRRASTGRQRAARLGAPRGPAGAARLRRLAGRPPPQRRGR